MQCPQCHAAVPAGSIFCPNCGSRLIQNTPNQYDSRFAPSSWPPQPQPAPQTHSMPPQPAPSQPTPRTHQRERGAAVAVKPLVIVLIIALVIAIPTTIYLLTSRHIFSNTSTTATNTSNNVFEPVEVTIFTDYLTDNENIIYFNSDGSELNILYDDNGYDISILALDTATHTIVNTSELSKYTSDFHIYHRAETNQTLVLVTEPDADLDTVETSYYLTVIDPDSWTTQRIYLGEGAWVNIITDYLINDRVYLNLHQTDQFDAFGEGTNVILRADLNTMLVETLGELPESTDILGESKSSTGVLLETDITRDDSLHYTATLIQADWDNPFDENLWQVLNNELTFDFSDLSPDGESIISRTSNANSSGTDTASQLTIRQYNADTGEETGSLVIPGFANDDLSQIYNADSSILFIGERYESPNTFAIIDLDSMELINCYELNSDLLGTRAISPTYSSLYVPDGNSSIQIVDLETGTITASMDIPNAGNADVGNIVISPDATFGYFTVFDDKQWRLYRFETDEQINIIDTISQWVAQNLTTTHLIIGGVTLAVVVAGGITAVIVIRRRKKATAVPRNNIPAGSGNLPPTNGGFYSGNIH